MKDFLNILLACSCPAIAVFLITLPYGVYSPEPILKPSVSPKPVYEPEQPLNWVGRTVYDKDGHIIAEPVQWPGIEKTLTLTLGDSILVIDTKGDILLRGEKIGHDKELGEVIRKLNF